MRFSMFVCNDMEAAWIAQICADGEREMAEWERGEDFDREEELARQAVEDEATDAWPWYADAPIEIAEPEIVEVEGGEAGPESQRCCPTCLDPIDDEDECSCIGPGWSTP